VLRFSRMREVVETLVSESKEDRGKDIESRACDGEPGASRRRDPFSELLRRSCSRGDMVAVGSSLRVEEDLQRSWKMDVVADLGEDAKDGVELPVHSEDVQVFGDTGFVSSVFEGCKRPVVLLSCELKARRRGLSGDAQADATRLWLDVVIGCTVPIVA